MPGEWFYSHFIYGSNYRMNEWQGAVLSVQLTRLDEQTARRHKNARVLDRLLGEIEALHCKNRLFPPEKVLQS
jgi:3-amino-5-hydroxybenzoate synthase